MNGGEKLRFLLEVLGWILAAVGAYYLFEDNTMLIHYIMLVIGIILLIMTISKSYRKSNDKKKSGL